MQKQSTLVTLFSIMVMIGCGDGINNDVERVAVLGNVSLDGKPLNDAAIVFHQLDVDGQLSGRMAHAFLENGRYRIEEKDGPIVGQARVEFRPKPVSRERMEASLASSYARRCPVSPFMVQIPEKYAGKSKLVVSIQSGQLNQHHFELWSR